MSSIQDQLQFVCSPRIVIALLADNPRAAFAGFKRVLFPAVLCKFAVLLWALGGATVTMPAFRKIPDEQCYFYQLIFLIPMFLIAWLPGGGVAYMASEAFGGSGSYDNILGGFGMTACVSAYFARIPDDIQGFLWTTGWVPFTAYQEWTSHGFLAVIVWGHMLACSIAYLVQNSTTVHCAQNPSNSKSVIAAAIAHIISAVFSSSSFDNWRFVQRGASGVVDRATLKT